MIKRLLAILAVTSVVLVGCGSGSDDSSGVSEDKNSTPNSVANSGDDPTPGTGFVAQADAICENSDQYVDERAEALLNSSSEPTEAEIEELGGLLSKAFFSMADDIEALDTSDVDSDKVAEMLVALRDSAQLISDDPQLIMGEQPQVMVRASALAAELGLETCG